jgi:hypothetical protein
LPTKEVDGWVPVVALWGYSKRWGLTITGDPKPNKYNHLVDRGLVVDSNNINSRERLCIQLDMTQFRAINTAPPILHTTLVAEEWYRYDGQSWPSAWLGFWIVVMKAGLSIVHVPHAAAGPSDGTRSVRCYWCH